MYTYSHDLETGGLILEDSLSEFSKEPRPVWAKELDLLGFDKFWKYDSNCPDPYLWAEANFYWYRGKKVAKTNGGSLYEKPEIELLKDETDKEVLPEGASLLPVNMAAMAAKNRLRLEALETLTVKKIYDIYRKYEKKLDCFHVAFSGGKDSIVLLELVCRALPRTAFMVVFGDTGMEFPDTYKAVEEVETRCKADGIAFYRAKSRFEPEESWRLFGPPSRVLRWCCTVHKSVPQTLKIREVLGKRDYTGMDFVGVRGHESASRAEYEYENYSKKQKGQYSYNPMLEWTSAEVWLYIFFRGLVVNEAYMKGNARVGCLFCPHSADKSDWFRRMNYPDEVNKFERLIREGVDDPSMDTYISCGGWIERSSGRDIKENEVKIFETIDNGRVMIRMVNPATDWREWIKTLPELVDVRNETTEGMQIATDIKDGFPEVVVSYPAELSKTASGKILKQCFIKATYCVECGACETNCRSGVLSFKNGLHIENCIHCGQCHVIPYGCHRADSLKIPFSNNTRGTKMKSLNTFDDHAPKPDWIFDFFYRGDNFITDNSLGPNQKTKFKRFLSDAGLITKNKTTAFYELVKKLGVNAEDTWGLILVNLANENPQIEWYVRNMDAERVYVSQEIIDVLAPLGVKEKDARSILKSFRRLCETPLGKKLKFGTFMDTGHALQSITRTIPEKPSPRVMLYALYKFAEKCGGYWEFSLSRLLDFTVESDGVSPAQTFALSRDEMEAILNGLARTNPDFVTFTTTHDLELVRLADDKTSSDVISLFN